MIFILLVQSETQSEEKKQPNNRETSQRDYSKE